MTPRKPPRCSDCRRFPIRYHEASEAFTTFEADAQGRPEQEGHHSHGDLLYVVAECACGNKWRVRGVTQIINIEMQAG